MSRWTNKINYQKSYNGYTNIDGVSSYQKCLFADFFLVSTIDKNEITSIAQESKGSPWQNYNFDKVAYNINIPKTLHYGLIIIFLATLVYKFLIKESNDDVL